MCKGKCEGLYDDGIADGNPTSCNRSAGCGYEGCPSDADRAARELSKIGTHAAVPSPPGQTLREQILGIAHKWMGDEALSMIGSFGYRMVVTQCILHAFDNNLDCFNAGREIRALHRARALLRQGDWASHEMAVE